MKILIVEDDPMVAKTIVRGWPSPSDKIEVVCTVGKCSRLIATSQIDEFDVIVLDMNLPDGNAIQIISELRLRSQLPVIVISGSGGPEVRANTLDIGADDYIMKPFSVRELQARAARAANRFRGQTKVEEVFDFGLLRFDALARTLVSPHIRLSLTDMESRLLFQLAINAGKACSRQQLSETVCFRTFRPEDKTIDIYIGRLRAMFDQFFDDAVIETVRGVGYRFILPPA
ncbi:response regulator transcription factor [Hoeflea sp.]|uniref:response regulator transcription factor n=1 Tax=Hoeflea sp. TaxID=1940281 RepID=UPI0019AD717D|nr:response regulator transcription factor [Hoeflea sp.]MBC7282969.1 response regulator transcription factor [Hoeflea sp.]